jgi:hypothetical protein
MRRRRRRRKRKRRKMLRDNNDEDCPGNYDTENVVSGPDSHRRRRRRCRHGQVSPISKQHNLYI